jgi:anti-sigma regulatory factor (Ser/Thr protein kinase)
MAESLHIKNEISQLARLNEYLLQATGTLGLCPSVYRNLKLAVEEAVVNIIRYAYPGESDRDIHIRLENNREKITVVITDYGIAFDPTAVEAPDISLPLEKRPVGGLGTYLISQLTSGVSYHRTENKNVLELTLIKNPRICPTSTSKK